MRKMSKRLLAVLLSVLMVCTVLPFSPMTAMADAQSDLEAKCAEYEQFVVDFGNADLGESGFGALKTNMYPAYQAYLAALEALEDGTESEMQTATTNLTNAMNAMDDFTPVTANAEVKIGDGKVYDKNGNVVDTSQPVAGTDYANVIYSDGANATNWDDAFKFFVGGTYSLITAYYYRVASLYYPNTVILNDGTSTPMVPVIVGFRAPTSSEFSSNVAPEYTLQTLYENTPKVYLKGYWQGTNDGYQGSTFNYPYTVPTWPNLQLPSGDKYFIYEMANRGGMHPSRYNKRDTSEADYKYPYRWVSNSETKKYMMFRNSICYKDPETPVSGLSTVDSIRWLSSIDLTYNVMFFGTASGDRASVPSNSNKTKLYVVNYNLLTDALKKFMSEHKTTSQKSYYTAENAKNNTLGSIFKALDRATGFNPNDTTKYNYASNIATAAKDAGDEIDAAIDDLDKATLDGIAMGYQGLLDAIAAYEAKMNNGEMFTNMADAYKAFLSAIDYRDAYLYAGRRDFTPSLQEVAHNLIVATRNMVELNEAFAYEAHSEQAFDGDSDTDTKSGAYYETYKNLIYVSNGPDRVRSDNASEEEKTANGKVIKINTGDYSENFLYIPDAVAVYDGFHEGADYYTVPALVGSTSQGGGLSSLFSDDERHLYAFYLPSNNANNTGLSFVKDFWITRAYEPGDEDKYIDKNGDYNKFWFNVEQRTGTDSDREKLYQYVTKARAQQSGYTLPTRTYIETASLNELLNADSLDEIKEAQYAINAKNNTWTAGKVANMRSDHGGNVDDPENFYANILKFDNPYDENDHYDSTKNFTQFYHHYSKLTATAYSCKTVSSKQNPTSNSGSNYSSGTLNKLGLYVINYKPIVDLIVSSSALVRDEDFQINYYQEGNLLGYFEDFDKLTSVSPSNKKKYPFSNDSYTVDSDSGITSAEGYISGTTGHDAAVQQNAYDMYQLFASNDEDVKLNYIVDEDGAFDEDYIEQCQDENGGIMDNKTVEGGDYKNLVDIIRKTPEEAGVGTCQDGVWWNRYDAAVAAGRQAFCQVADVNNDPDGRTPHMGFYDHDVITFSYQDDGGYTITETITYTDSTKTHTVASTEPGVATTTTDISDKKSAIDALATAIGVDLAFLAGDEVPRTRHNVKFKKRQSDVKKTAGQDYNVLDYDVAIFECANDDTHTDLYPKSISHAHDDLADISAYNALAAAVDTIDLDRYTNDNIIKNAKENQFDTVLTETGAAGVEPQTIVDNGITAMLTAINTSNNGEYYTDYDVTFKCVDKDGNTIDIDKYENIEYGTVQTLSVPSDKGVPYKWVVEKYKGKKSVLVNYAINQVTDEQTGEVSYVEDNSNSSFDVKVQDNITVTAYCKLDTKNDYRILKIKDKYNKVFEQQYIAANKQVTVDANDNTKLKAGNDEIVYDKAFLSVPGYNFKEFEVKPNLDNSIINVKSLFERDGAFANKITIGNEQYDYDTLVDYTSANSSAADYKGIAAYVDNKFVPVSYSGGLKIYAFGDMNLFDIRSRTVTQGQKSATEYYVIDGENNEIKLSGDYERLALDNQLPFAYSDIKKTGTINEKDKITAFTIVTEGLNDKTRNDFEVVERGTIVASGQNADATEATMTLENLGDGIQKVQAPNYIDEDNDITQYSVTINTGTGLKARSYVKYRYTLQGETIEAVIYGNFVEYSA